MMFDIIHNFAFCLHYGKLLFELSEQPVIAAQSAKITRSGTAKSFQPAQQLAFYQQMVKELMQHPEVQASMSAECRQEIAVALENQRGDAAHWEATHRLLRWLDEIPALGLAGLRWKTNDVFHYLTVPTVQRQVNEIIETAFDTQPCVVVGHSLGSVVSYLVLQHNPQFKVVQFITLGSPLGVRTIRQKLGGAIRMPKCVQKGWFNAYDEGDVVALNPLDQTFFNIQPPIVNKKNVQNHTSNKHGITGYLDDAEVARTIYNALFLSI